MVKTATILFLSIVTAIHAQPACDSTTANVKPMDQISVTHNDSTGGLYQGNSNTRPTTHTTVGTTRGLEIAPRTSTGVINWSTGKIGFILIGMSNLQRIGWFMRDTLQSAAMQKKLNPKVVFQSCAQPNVSLTDMVDTTINYWTNIVPDSLTAGGLTAKQVGAVVFYNVIRRTDATVSWPGYPQNTRNKTLRIMRVIQNKFPYCKVLFINSREYCNYSGGAAAHNELDTYWHGWGQKWAIWNQIWGVDSVSYAKGLSYKGNAPWTDWMTYNWADGSATGATARSDGLKWVCADYENDGIHPDTPGVRKIVIRWLNKLQSDITMRTWFLRNSSFY